MNFNLCVFVLNKLTLFSGRRELYGVRGEYRSGALYGEEKRQWLILEAHFPTLPSTSLQFLSLPGWVFHWRPVPGPLCSGFFCLSLLRQVSRVWQTGCCPDAAWGDVPLPFSHLPSLPAHGKLLWPRLGPGARPLWDPLPMPNLAAQSLGEAQPMLPQPL